jgi:hypothetical protein
MTYICTEGHGFVDNTPVLCLGGTRFDLGHEAGSHIQDFRKFHEEC